MKKIKHGNIIRLIGIVSDPKNLGFVMEYHENGSLFDSLHKVNNSF